ncbi:A24 family peptidase [Brevundimonas nasdae]|uniref:A24 family peptidase n=1 Tax=Brevundimonas nasdae TaxID=172043 RepID=UPI003F690E34
MDAAILIALGAMPALVIAGGLHDLLTMKIPNWISLALALLFFPTALLAGLRPEAVAIHVGIGLAALFVGAGMFALRWIGGGDAKLMAATCLWLGLSGSGVFLLWTGVVGGLFCLFLMTARQHLQMVTPYAPGWAVRLLEPKGDIPYGVAIAIGALLAFPGADLMQSFALTQ